MKDALRASAARLCASSFVTHTTCEKDNNSLFETSTSIKKHASTKNRNTKRAPPTSKRTRAKEQAATTIITSRTQGTQKSFSFSQLPGSLEVKVKGPKPHLIALSVHVAPRTDLIEVCVSAKVLEGLDAFGSKGELLQPIIPPAEYWPILLVLQ